MSNLELFILAVGLSMDAFAVSICKGLSMEKTTIKEMSIVGLWFGGFQALMPFFGFILGEVAEKYIERIDHWIAFSLLALIGILMVAEALKKNDEKTDASLAFCPMLTMAIATSIDALAVGISFGVLPDVNIFLAISLIGITTFAFCFIGVKVGNVFGKKYKSRAELAGGIILILLGLKILLEHLGVLK